MPEEEVDTQEETPTEENGEGSQEPTEEPTEEITYITQEQLQEALKQQDASFRSWLGRRDKETLDHIGNVIDSRLSTQQPITTDEASRQLLEDPDNYLQQQIEKYNKKATYKQTKALSDTMTVIGNLMESDPLYTDKELGNEVVEHIKTMVQANRIDTSLPAEAAGKVVLADALGNVIRNRKTKVSNPLKGNKISGGDGGVPPPGKPPKKPLKVPKLDAEAKRLAEKWGYKEEDIARVFGEDST